MSLAPSGRKLSAPIGLALIRALFVRDYKAATEILHYGFDWRSSLLGFIHWKRTCNSVFLHESRCTSFSHSEVVWIVEDVIEEMDDLGE